MTQKIRKITYRPVKIQLMTRRRTGMTTKTPRTIPDKTAQILATQKMKTTTTIVAINNNQIMSLIRLNQQMIHPLLHYHPLLHHKRLPRAAAAPQIVGTTTTEEVAVQSSSYLCWYAVVQVRTMERIESIFQTSPTWTDWMVTGMVSLVRQPNQNTNKSPKMKSTRNGVGEMTTMLISSLHRTLITAKIFTIAVQVPTERINHWVVLVQRPVRKDPV
mmetsp:Transcript_46784/g.114019  ORF Transcript_46784/g.114019 Transcript_46784/m.114019 type:complete len:217 (+) Transcript_46784:1509-2159(+)